MNDSFSIIIPTFNRKKYLEDTLNCIDAQIVKPLEIIVIDASHKDYQLTQETYSKFPLLKYYHWNEYGNISKQRNFGIERAKGDYILFLDDDVVFEPNLIDNYITAFRETNADGISGLIETTKYRKGSKAFKYSEVLLNTNEENIQACDFIAPTKLICTASFAIKKDVLKSVNGFDEFQRGTFDDIELGFRLANNNFRIIHHPLPVVFHIQAPASGARDIKHGMAWGVENQTYFMLKHIYSDTKNLFLLKLIFEVLKPSRAWKFPRQQLQKINLRLKAYKRALELLKI